MKTGIIVVNSYAEIQGISYQSERLTAEFENLGVKINIVKTEDIPFSVDGGRAVALIEGDFAIFLDKDNYAARILEKSGMKLFNSASAIELCDDKMLTHIALSGGGINMPHTVPSLLCYKQDTEASEKFIRRVKDELGFPMIGKSSFGSLGRGVFLIENMDSLIKCEENLMYRPHLYQKYIPSSRGRDIRVIVIGKKAVGGMLRKNENDFRSNIEGGGTGERAELKSEFARTAEKAAEILGLDYCGVDLLIGENGEPVLCEVNSNAFFTGFEKATGINVAGLYAEYIYEKIYGRIYG